MNAPARPAAPVLAALYVWTFGTGLIDAVSFIRLDHVFVANMTGNVVFLGLAAIGEQGIVLTTVFAAIGGFVLGAFVTGHLLLPRRRDGGRLLLPGVLGQMVLVVGALVTVALHGPTWALALLLGLCMGTQNAIARALKVPDATTTVVTLTVTGLAADPIGGQNLARRIGVVLVLLLGAAAGGLLLQISLAAPLVAVMVTSAVVGGLAIMAGRAERS